MKINGEVLPTISVYPQMISVADCFVVGSNKIGTGHGEAKFYISSKSDMVDFYGGKNFVAKCFMLKSDLIAYMNAVKPEYHAPSQNYAKKEKFPQLWGERLLKLQALDDVIFFTIRGQDQIEGRRFYINSEDSNYKIIREISLPLISYIYVEKVGNENSPLYYWKLFVDFDAIWEKKNGPLVLHYGKGKSIPQSKTDMADTGTPKKQPEITKARNGQGKYREQLLAQCRFCPITMISDDRLLTASHIKPWAASTDKEKIDPNNGYMFSPMFDRLFDRGFITFTDSKHIILSEFIAPFTWKQIGLQNNKYIQTLPMDDKRMEYLKFHRQFVFKGHYDFETS